MDAHRGPGPWGGGGKLVELPSKIFTELVNKNAKKPEKFAKNLMDPPPGFSNLVHLCLDPIEIVNI
jgi:hypothetical protein